MSKQIEQALRELHTALCGVRQVGEIDGHVVIRRESVLDLVSQRIFNAAQAAASAPNPSDKQEAAALTDEQREILKWCANYHARRILEGNYHLRITALIHTILANPSDKQETAILQIQRHNGSWLDATQYAYDNTAENRRRIVYLGGQA